MKIQVATFLFSMLIALSIAAQPAGGKIPPPQDIYTPESIARALQIGQKSFRRSWGSNTTKRVAKTIYWLSDYYGINPSRVISTMEIESNYKIVVVGRTDPNDKGLMQLNAIWVPYSKCYYRIRKLMKSFKIKSKNHHFHPETNVACGIRQIYINQLPLTHRNLSEEYLISSYNLGSRGVFHRRKAKRRRAYYKNYRAALKRVRSRFKRGSNDILTSSVTNTKRLH